MNKKSALILVLELVFIVGLTGQFIFWSCWLVPFSIGGDAKMILFTIGIMCFGTIGIASLWAVMVHRLTGNPLHRPFLWKTGLWIGICFSVALFLSTTLPEAMEGRFNVFVIFANAVGYLLPVVVACHFLYLLKKRSPA